jgi:quercetin dioxygenase-like cupin family protein
MGRDDSLPPTGPGWNWSTYSIVEKPWGYEQILSKITDDPEKGATVGKNLVVYKGQKLSYQYHTRRHETWRVISGKCKITLDGKEFLGMVGTIWKIPRECKHRIEAIEDTVIGEVSTHVFDDDIVRLDDIYGRIKK